jgi:hypothetical protein
MEETQRKVVANLKSQTENLLRNFSSDDACKTIGFLDVEMYMRHLWITFFLGAPVKIELMWNIKDMVEHDTLGFTETTERDGQEIELIMMHPTKKYTHSWISDQGRSMALDRVSTVVHELIHAFLDSLGCSKCASNHENMSNHGRAFQILAKAIEEQAPRLIGLQLNLGRLDGMMVDMEEEEEKRNVPSVHDLEVYGFIDPPAVSV